LKGLGFNVMVCDLVTDHVNFDAWIEEGVLYVLLRAKNLSKCCSMVSPRYSHCIREVEGHEATGTLIIGSRMVLCPGRFPLGDDLGLVCCNDVAQKAQQEVRHRSVRKPEPQTLVLLVDLPPVAPRCGVR